MSNFTHRTKNPTTGEFEDAEWLDNHFGTHHYGVRFPSTGIIYRDTDHEWETYPPARRCIDSPISAAAAEAIWQILVEECGCRDAAKRAEFLAYVTTPGQKEYRFQGALGFSGKFYNDLFSWRVGCYLEDSTPERRVRVAIANARLAVLRLDQGET